jgi:hypothetical protein
MAFNKKRGGAVGLIAALTAVVTALLTVFGAHGPGWTEIPATMKIRYQATETQSTNWGQPRLLKDELVVIKHRLANHMGESFIIRAWNSNEWSVKRNLDGTMDRLKYLLSHANNHQKYLVRAVADTFTLKAMKVDLNPAAFFDQDGATFPVKIIIGTLHRLYPNIRTSNPYVCKYIAGTGQLSQHSYGNAEDVFGTSAQMNAAAYGMYRLAREGWVPLSQVLWNHKNLFTGNYVADHTTHVHFTASPLLSGSCRRPS